LKDKIKKNNNIKENLRNKIKENNNLKIDL